MPEDRPAAPASAVGADTACPGGRPVDSTQSPKLQQPTLRDYQIDIVEQVERLAHPLIPLPTGGGKTVIAAHIIGEAIAAGRRILFVVHRRELVLQASAKLLAEGVDHAILMGAESSEYLGQRCVVASVQTLYARAFRSKRIALPPADIILVDEAHHARARTYVEIRRAYPRVKLIGLTATPARGDGRGLGGDLFSDLVKVPTYTSLIENKHLVPPAVFAPVNPDLRGVKTLDTGDYSPSQLEERMNTKALVGGIVEHWFKLGENRPTIVFTAGVRHSAHLRDEFRAAGIAAEHLEAATPLADRKRIIAGFRAGDVKVVTNCMILTEGFDEPSTSCLILARPTKLLTMYKQMVGRALRPYPGKVDATILDHSGAVYRHGYPDDEIRWVLSPDEKAVNESAKARANSHHSRALTTCPKCTAVRLEGDGCRVCGWKPEVRPKPLYVVDGELGQVRRDRSVAGMPFNEVQFYRELLAIAAHKGWKPVAAAHRFKEKAGRFPPWAWNGYEPLPPSPATIAWVHSRAIAYAKSRQ
jgi:DNA repair protein RadD